MHRVVVSCGDGEVAVLCEPFPWDTRRALGEATQQAEWGLGEELGFGRGAGVRAPAAGMG